ncbi:MAG: hypothetical protein ACYDDA_01790 [Acidiferrobacteraceae bacterium]
MAHALRLVNTADGGELVGLDWPLIPDGEYTATCSGWKTAYIFRAPKLYLRFRIIDGPYSGAELFAAFRMSALIGKPGPNGKFKAQRRSRLVLMLAALTGQRLRGDRLALRWLTRCVLRIKTRTVAQNYKQSKLPKCLHYSIVDDILTVEAGADDIRV